ncbi:hypothetical protein [Endozoicomonas sp. 4G]|uniref:hypothetical protein n=1 Tax=Endozoicomonas sp. 4G TaxID=2872754 RepID=UPI002078ABC5|nr:hypothetical protein [Endozoicomonas sp. 4G]
MSKPTPLTPEQQAQQTALMEAYIAQMKAKTAQLQQGSQPVPVQRHSSPIQPELQDNIKIISEEELNSQLSELGDKSGAAFKRKRDGLLINNMPFFDPEGEILDFTANNHTGDFTYLVKTGDRTGVVKYANAGNLQKSVTLANLKYSRGNYSITTVTGKNLRGQIVTPTSKGFSVSRNGSIFIYEAGNEQLASFTPPDGYHVARFQNGDIASTGYILVERNEPEKGSMDELMNFGTLGNLMGISEVSDYMLVGLSSGKSIPLVMTTGGKTTGFYSSCVKKSDFINECAQAEFRNSLYEKDGTPNMGHYYWRVSWYDTPEGSFSVSMEQGSKKINIRSLDTKEKATLFERSLGINDYAVSQDSSGKLTVKAKLAFSLKEVPDAVDFWKKNKDLMAAEK